MKWIMKNKAAGKRKSLAFRVKVLALWLEKMRHNRYAKTRLVLRAKAILLRVGALGCSLYSFLAVCGLPDSILGETLIPWHLYIFAALGGAGGFAVGLALAVDADTEVYRLMETEWRDAALSGMMPHDRRHIG